MRTQFDYSDSIDEASFTQEYNLNRDEIIRWRKDNLEKGYHYARTKTSPPRIVLTPEALELVKREFLTDHGHAVQFRTKPMGRGILRVVSVPKINTKILIAEDNFNNRKTVHVRSNANFVPGMEIKVQKSNHEGEYTMSATQNLPRARGRW